MDNDKLALLLSNFGRGVPVVVEQTNGVPVYVADARLIPQSSHIGRSAVILTTRPLK